MRLSRQTKPYLSVEDFPPAPKGCQANGQFVTKMEQILGTTPEYEATNAGQDNKPFVFQQLFLNTLNGHGLRGTVSGGLWILFFGDGHGRGRVLLAD
jgi:hypothetical protein